MVPSDAELLRRIDAARDRETFAEFYDRFAARVYGLLLRLLQNRTDADDVLQETFLQVWNQAGRFDPERSIPQGWVLMLARSRALDRLRKRPSTPTAPSPEPSTLSEVGSDLLREEAVEALRVAMIGLPHEQREPIRLAFMEGHTHEQIAKLLDQPLGTVKTRIRLGMMRLRERFSRAEGD